MTYARPIYAVMSLVSVSLRVTAAVRLKRLGDGQKRFGHRNNLRRGAEAANSLPAPPSARAAYFPGRESALRFI